MNAYNPYRHHRRSIRLKGYDYTQSGLYFLTICVQHRQCLFGDVMHGVMMHNDAGRMVENEWLKLSERFRHIRLYEYIVMPNHFHAIVEIVGATLVVAQTDGTDPIKGQPQGIAPTAIVTHDTDPMNGQPQGIARTAITHNRHDKRLGDVVGAFKSLVTVEYIRGIQNHGWQPFHGAVWQRNYWEHIIRNEQSYHNIAEYITHNPTSWHDDRFFSA
jgi:putative transposase